MFTIDVIQAVCGHDSPDYLSESIASILNQTRSVDNYIIVRDGLLGNGLNRVLGRAHGLTIIDNTRNKGLAGALNTAIGASSSDILVRMDSDDIAAPDRIEVIINEFNTNEHLLVVGSSAQEIDSRGNLFFIKNMPATSGEIARYAMTRSPFIHPSVAFRKIFFDHVGLYNENYAKAQDYELWARAIIHHPDLLAGMKNIDRPIMTVRLPDDFWVKRSLANIRYGTPISLKLIHHFGAYSKLIPLLIKILIRLSPRTLKEYAYKHFR